MSGFFSRPVSALFLALIIGSATTAIAQYNDVGQAASRSAPGSAVTPPLFFKTGVHAGLGYGFTTGDWYRDVGSSHCIDLGVRLAAGDHTYLHFQLFRQDLDVPDGLGYIGEDIVSFPRSYHLNEFFFLVGIRTSSSRPSSLMSFVEGGIGIQDSVFSAEVPEAWSGSASVSDSNVAVALMVGVLIPVSELFAVEVKVSGRVKPGIDLYPNDSNEEPGGVVGGVHVGMMAAFGGVPD